MRISKVLLVHISFKLQSCSKIETGRLLPVFFSEDADLKQPNDLAIKLMAIIKVLQELTIY